MRSRVSLRILAIVLLLAHLELVDFIHLPIAQATAVDVTRPMPMKSGEPCSGMGSMTMETELPSAIHAENPLPAKDASCCKSSHCACLHVPALMPTLQIPMSPAVSYGDVPQSEPPRISDPPAVFFRPPI